VNDAPECDAYYAAGCTGRPDTIREGRPVCGPCADALDAGPVVLAVPRPARTPRPAVEEVVEPVAFAAALLDAARSSRPDLAHDLRALARHLTP
jgi:hypothetical protein